MIGSLIQVFSSSVLGVVVVVLVVQTRWTSIKKCIVNRYLPAEGTKFLLNMSLIILSCLICHVFNVAAYNGRAIER